LIPEPDQQRRLELAQAANAASRKQLTVLATIYAAELEQLPHNTRLGETALADLKWRLARRSMSGTYAREVLLICRRLGLTKRGLTLAVIRFDQLNAKPVLIDPEEAEELRRDAVRAAAFRDVILVLERNHRLLPMMRLARRLRRGALTAEDAEIVCDACLKPRNEQNRAPWDALFACCTLPRNPLDEAPARGLRAAKRVASARGARPRRAAMTSPDAAGSASSP
jgi:hypothetical protein